MNNPVVMGVDLGIHKVAVSVLVGEDALMDVDIHKAPRGDRSAELYKIAHWVHEMADDWAVEYVFIEDGVIGNNRKYSIALAQTAGAVLAQLFPMMLTISMVNNKTWKKEVLGNGNATKDMVRMWLDATYPAYAERCDADQDQYDAVCVGLYGVELVNRSRRLLDAVR